MALDLRLRRARMRARGPAAADAIDDPLRKDTAMRSPLPALLPLLGALLLAACAQTPAPAPARAPVSVKLLAINDFHGNLLPPAGGIRIQNPDKPTEMINVDAGGAAHLASAVRELRGRNPHVLCVDT
eukprot:Opistho-2@70459